LTDDKVAALARELRAAAPHDLLVVLDAGLRRLYGANSAVMLMADYGLSVLQPVLRLPRTGEPVPIGSSPAGQAFTSQEPRAEDGGPAGTRLYLPVTVRGDRLGVLMLTLSSCPDPATADELLAVAANVGHEIIVAERDTDLFLQARRLKRLTLAAEMQWQLLPGRACERPEYAIGAQLEPAYAIGADNFDWSSDGDLLTVSVSNGMGEGMEGALLTSLAVNAMRNARRAGIGLADQASLTDQAIYAQYGGKLHVGTLLLGFDLATGEVSAVDAGSPRMLRLRGGQIEPVVFDAQLPLGMFDRTRYTEQQFTARPGDRYVIVSDGVHAARSAIGEEYGMRALIRSIARSQLAPPPETARAILHDLLTYTQLTDDAIVFCLDWRGRAG
jgi:serine phosphatase RsbU (regulator of sigma subunit)